jgi:ATP-dependent Clp protease ATP-binding subunit ClpC
MFERYTEHARRVIYFARTEALARTSPVIDTKDLLLGLTYNLYADGHPFAMLHTRRDELRTLMGSLPIEKMPEAKEIPLSRDSKIALAHAGMEASKDKRFSLEPYHLLRGIVCCGDSTAIALSTLGWNIEMLRVESKKCQQLFPSKRPPLRRILRHYRNPITATIAFTLLASLIAYLQWQQR